MKRRARTVTAVAGVLLFLAGVAAGVFVWRSRQPGPAAYRVTLQSVPPSETADWNPATTTCPKGGRGHGPLGADALPVNPAATPGGPAQQLGGGQLVAYHLRVEADPTAPPTSRVGADLSFRVPPKDAAIDGQLGLVCAFVDQGDALTTSTGATAMSVSTPPKEKGQPIVANVSVDGVERGTSTVVELWVRAAPDQPRSTTVLEGRVSAVTVPDGSRARLVSDAARQAVASKANKDVVVEVAPPGAPPQPGQPLTVQFQVRNQSSADLARDVVTQFTPDPALNVTKITVHDDTGTATNCALAAGAINCASAYLVPSERVVVDAELGLAADAPRVYTGSGAKCAPQAQDLCLKAALVSIAGSPVDSQIEQAIDLPAPDVMVASKVTADGSRGLYVGRYTDFLYVVALGTQAPLAKVAVADPSCGPVTFVSGDNAADTVLSPGETWVFRCSAVVDRSQQADVIVKASTGAGEPVQAVARLAEPILDPELTIDDVELEDGPGVEVLNSGDTELSAVVIDGRTCAGPVVRGDADSDNVLDPGERWAFGCRESSGAVRADGTDPAGGAVTASLGP